MFLGFHLHSCASKGIQKAAICWIYLGSHLYLYPYVYLCIHTFVPPNGLRKQVFNIYIYRFSSFLCLYRVSETRKSLLYMGSYRHFWACKGFQAPIYIWIYIYIVFPLLRGCCRTWRDREKQRLPSRRWAQDVPSICGGSLGCMYIFTYIDIHI